MTSGSRKDDVATQRRTQVKPARLMTDKSEKSARGGEHLWRLALAASSIRVWGERAGREMNFGRSGSQFATLPEASECS